MRASRHFIKTLYMVGSREMSRQVEGSSGLLSFFGVLYMRAPFQESGTRSLIRQVLKMYVSVCVEMGLVALRVS